MRFLPIKKVNFISTILLVFAIFFATEMSDISSGTGAPSRLSTILSWNTYHPFCYVTSHFTPPMKFGLFKRNIWFVFSLSFKIFILIYQWVLQIKVFEGSKTLIHVRTSWNQLTLKLQTLSRLFHLDYFAKCWQMFLELHCILKDCIKVQEKKKKVVVLCSRPRQHVNLGTFTL